MNTQITRNWVYLGVGDGESGASPRHQGLVYSEPNRGCFPFKTVGEQWRDGPRARDRWGPKGLTRRLSGQPHWGIQFPPSSSN